MEAVEGGFQYKRILAINLGGIGDVLLSTPALRSMKNAYPFAEISLLVLPHAKPMADRLGYITSVYPFQKAAPAWWGQSLRNMPLMLNLRQLRYHLAINMHTIASQESANKIQALLEALKAAHTAGRNTEGRAPFFEISIPEQDFGQQHEMEYHNAMAEILGAKVEDRTLDLSIRSDDTNAVQNLLRKEGVAFNQQVICVHPGGHPTHQWPVHYFAHALKHLHTRTALPIVIAGSTEEAPLAHSLAKATGGRTVNLAGKISPMEFAALMKRTSLFLTNDTDLMHIAAATDAPMVALFGAGDVHRYDPRKISARCTVLVARTSCAPCNNITCGTMECMQGITPEEVISAADAILMH